MPENAFRRRIAPFSLVEIAFNDDKGEFRKKFRLAFNLNVLAEISERTGRESLGLSIWANFDAAMLRAMLWAALLPYQPDLDTRDLKGARTDEGFETVASWITAENQAAVTNALFEAYLLYLPKDEADRLRARMEERRKEKQGEGASPLEQTSTAQGPAPGSGSNSGPSADTTSESPKAKSAS